jgi:hypothetical protein
MKVYIRNIVVYYAIFVEIFAIKNTWTNWTGILYMDLDWDLLEEEHKKMRRFLVVSH